jgi:two-component system, LytTR family, sensor kinase
MGELLNLIGLSIGVVLYAMLLLMVVRIGRGATGRGRVDGLLLWTSVLGLIWNLCSLPDSALLNAGAEGSFPLITAIGCGALGFLPAVVVHSVLRGERDLPQSSGKRVVSIAAYAVSAGAAALQFAAAGEGEPVPSPAAMRLLTYAFVALVAPVVAMTLGQRRARRALWVSALAVFAVSALHLSQLHRGAYAWPVELVGHHASLPLAFAILYQDYPFALADLFLKRTLALLGTVTLAFVAVTIFGSRSPAFAEFLRGDPRQVGTLVTLWVATALVYPSVRRLTAWFVDSVILHRPDYRALRRTVGQAALSDNDVPRMLTRVCAMLEPALSSPNVEWHEQPPHHDFAASTIVLSGTDAAGAVVSFVDRTRHPAAVVLIQTSEPPRYLLVVSPLTGGRRLLSDDTANLETIALLVARRIDAVRITQARDERERREQEMDALTTEAELRALRAQINPHFLFNALTTIGYLIQTSPPSALDTLMRLTSLLRAVLRSEGELTSLEREIEIVEAYLEIERARFEARLRFTIDVPAPLHSLRVPPLILQPLVENAVKHGIAPKRLGGEVLVQARLDPDDSGFVLLVVRDTGGGATSDALERGRAEGVGLTNVERRLAGHYGPSASLRVTTSDVGGTTVTLRVPLEAALALETRAKPGASAGQLPGQSDVAL